MKNLQETQEQKWQFQSAAELSGVIRKVPQPDSIVLLLHGLNERGKRIYRKLLPYLPKNAIVIAPNGPFPLPRQKDGRLSYGHAWYFYNKLEQCYFIDQTLAKNWLRDLVKYENPEKLPVTIIGFSQGGYLAPLVGEEIPETNLVIGLACEFRTTLIKKIPAFKMIAIHGTEDEIVRIEPAKKEIQTLNEQGHKIDFHSVSGTHEINSEMTKIIQNILEEHGKRSL